MECVEERLSDKEESMRILWGKVKHVKSEIESDYIYHSHCCKSITNKTDSNRSKERFDKSKDDSRNVLNQCFETAKILSTSDEKSVSSTPQTNKQRLHSSASIFNKEACIICQSNEGTLHKVAIQSTGEKTLDVAKNL